jgi:hypothetical protein
LTFKVAAPSPPYALKTSGKPNANEIITQNECLYSSSIDGVATTNGGEDNNMIRVSGCYSAGSAKISRYFNNLDTDVECTSQRACVVKARPSAPVSTTTSCALGKECEAQCGGGWVQKSGRSGKFTLGYSEVTTYVLKTSGKPTAYQLITTLTECATAAASLSLATPAASSYGTPYPAGCIQPNSVYTSTAFNDATDVVNEPSTAAECSDTKACIVRAPPALACDKFTTDLKTLLSVTSFDQFCEV